MPFSGRAVHRAMGPKPRRLASSLLTTGRPDSRDLSATTALVAEEKILLARDIRTWVKPRSTPHAMSALTEPVKHTPPAAVANGEPESANHATRMQTCAFACLKWLNAATPLTADDCARKPML